MKTYQTTVSINASAERVWSLLTDAPRYPEWNPTVLRIDGAIEAGKQIKLLATVSPKRAFVLTVTELRKPQSMVWRGGMPLGLFTGERTFSLQSESSDATKFTMREVFSGALAPVLVRVMPDLTDSFEHFAAALKHAAEGA